MGVFPLAVEGLSAAVENESQDLDQLQKTEVQKDGKRFLLRNEAQGTCGSVFQPAGVALPLTVQQVEPVALEQTGDRNAMPVL